MLFYLSPPPVGGEKKNACVFTFNHAFIQANESVNECEWTGSCRQLIQRRRRIRRRHGLPPRRSRRAGSAGTSPSPCPPRRPRPRPRRGAEAQRRRQRPRRAQVLAPATNEPLQRRPRGVIPRPILVLVPLVREKVTRLERPRHVGVALLGVKVRARAGVEDVETIAGHLVDVSYQAVQLVEPVTRVLSYPLTHAHGHKPPQLVLLSSHHHKCPADLKCVPGTL